MDQGACWCSWVTVHVTLKWYFVLYESLLCLPSRVIDTTRRNYSNKAAPFMSGIFRSTQLKNKCMNSSPRVATWRESSSAWTRLRRRRAGSVSSSILLYTVSFLARFETMLCAVFNKIWRSLTGAVRYYTRGDAEHAMRFINGTRLDDRIIRTDWDAGFKEGRQYGRGKSGGQVRLEGLCTVTLLIIIIIISWLEWHFKANLFCVAQVRDEYRQDYDPARGGYGKLAQLQRGPEVPHKF